MMFIPKSDILTYDDKKMAATSSGEKSRTSITCDAVGDEMMILLLEFGAELGMSTTSFVKIFFRTMCRKSISDTNSNPVP